MPRIVLPLLFSACLVAACEWAEDGQSPEPTAPAARAAAPRPATIEAWQVAVPRPSEVPRNAAAGPAGTDNHTWLLNAVYRSNFPSLSYMSLDGGEIVFDLWCRWRGSVVLARMTDWKLNGATLRLASGPHRLSAPLGGSGEGDGPFMVGASLNEIDPALRNFGLTGRLSLRLRGKAISLDAINDGERAAVRRFFELCYFERPGEPPLPWRPPSTAADSLSPAQEYAYPGGGTRNRGGTTPPASAPRSMNRTPAAS